MLNLYVSIPGVVDQSLAASTTIENIKLLTFVQVFAIVEVAIVFLLQRTLLHFTEYFYKRGKWRIDFFIELYIDGYGLGIFIME